MLSADLRRTITLLTGNRTALGKIVDCYRSPGVHAVIAYRFGHWLLSRPTFVRLLLTPLHLLLDHRIRAKWGIQIQPEATIGEGFHIHHFGGVFVSGYTVIGRNFTLSHDVTIGAAGEGERRGAPTMGDNVYIAPGAKVNGKIIIGNNVRIGPNAVVIRSVPDNALVHLPKMQVVTFSSFGDQASPDPTDEQ
jgi:serine O-acetyltransferase